MKDRIRQLRQSAGLTQEQLANRAGITQQSVSKLERGKAGSSRELVAIAAALGTTAEHLKSGTGSAVNEDPAQYAPAGARVEVWETLDDLANPAAYVTVPHHNVHLSAGDGADAEWVRHENNDPLVFRARFFQARGLRPDRCKALYVRGESMAPTLEDGDTVLIDTSDTAPRDDAVFALLAHGELYIKRLFRIPGGGIELRSDNPRYPPRELRGADLEHIIILGRMVWRGG